MSQIEIIEVLEKSNVPLSASEICEKLQQRQVKISALLKKLIKHGDVEYIELDRRLSMKFYKCKRKLRLYYII